MLEWSIRGPDCLCVDQEIVLGSLVVRTVARVDVVAKHPPTQLPIHFLSRRLSDRRLPPHLEVFGPTVLWTTYGRHPYTACFWAHTSTAGESELDQKNDNSRPHDRPRTVDAAGSMQNDSSKNIFRVGAGHLKEPALLNQLC